MRWWRIMLGLVTVALGLGFLWLVWPRSPDAFTIALANRGEAKVWTSDYYIVISPEVGRSVS